MLGFCGEFGVPTNIRNIIGRCRTPEIGRRERLGHAFGVRPNVVCRRLPTIGKARNICGQSTSHTPAADGARTSTASGERSPDSMIDLQRGKRLLQPVDSRRRDFRTVDGQAVQILHFCKLLQAGIAERSAGEEKPLEVRQRKKFRDAVIGDGRFGKIQNFQIGQPGDVVQAGVRTPWCPTGAASPDWIAVEDWPFPRRRRRCCSAQGGKHA